MSERPDWLAYFPALAELDDPAWREIMAASRVVEVPAGQVVFHDGDACSVYMLVLTGSVRVQKTAESGREITLYRVEEGQSCVLTTSCLLAGERYPAEGITETDVTAVTIPMPQFQRGLAESPGFRTFVFEAYGRRISSLILLVEAVAFGRLDARLAAFVVQRAGHPGAVLATTHQTLAAELGTAREVVSRQLKEFERRGLVTLERGRVVVDDPDGLRRVAEQSRA